MDTIRFLIEADSSGLTSQLKVATNTVTGFINQMNDQNVNWEKILAGTISPAIISGIAATFALALTSAINFQNTMTTAANNSSTAFTQNLGQAGQAAIDISNQTGQSANDTANALGIATKALGSYASGQALVASASQFSTTTGIPLLELVNELIPVMQQWGITDAGKITTTITNLFGAAQQGKVTIQDLLTTMSNTGAMLAGKVSIDNAAASLEALSNEAGLSVPNSMALFQKASAAAFGDITAIAGLNALQVNMGAFNKAITNGDMGGALAIMDKSLTNIAGNSGKIAIVGTALGFSNEQMANMSNAAKYWDKIAADTDFIQKNEPKIGAAIAQNVSDSNQLKIAWENISNSIMKIIGVPLEKVASDALTGLSSAIQGASAKGGIFSGVKFSDFVDALGQNAKTFNTDFNKLTLGIPNAILGLANPMLGLPSDYGNTTPAGSSTVINNNQKTTNVNVSPGAINQQGGATTDALSVGAYNSAYGY